MVGTILVISPWPEMMRGDSQINYRWKKSAPFQIQLWVFCVPVDYHSAAQADSDVLHKMLHSCVPVSCILLRKRQMLFISCIRYPLIGSIVKGLDFRTCYWGVLALPQTYYRWQFSGFLERHLEMTHLVTQSLMREHTKLMHRPTTFYCTAGVKRW